MAADGQVQANIGEQAQQAPVEASGAVGKGAQVPEAGAILEQLQLSMKLQLAESEERKVAEAKRLEKEKADSARREHEEMLSALNSLTRGLKDPVAKEAAQFMATLAKLDDIAERRVLAKTFAEVQAQIEEDREDIEEANNILRDGIKKLKSLSAEEQEEVMKRLKIRKRKATSAVECARCGRPHPTEGCYSTKHKDGRPLEENGAVRRRSGASHGYGQQFSQFGAGPYGQQPPMMQQVPQQQMMQPPAVGYPQGGPGFSLQGLMPPRPAGCWNCHQPGHRSFECTQPKREQALGPRAGPAAQPPPPGLGPNVAVVSEQERETRQVLERAVRGADRDTVLLDVFGSSASKGKGKNQEGAKEEQVSEDSIASLYASTELWATEHEEQSEETEEEEKPHCQAMYVARLSCSNPHSQGSEAEHTTAKRKSNSDSGLEQVVSLEYKRASAAQMQQLARTGIEMTMEEGGGLPAGVSSLRSAIANSFEGKKKLLGDGEIRTVFDQAQASYNIRIKCDDSVD